jgi:hypothetical protein
LAAEVVLEVAQGKAGTFNTYLGGSELMECQFRADKLLGPDFSDYSLHLDTWPRDVSIRANMSCSDWNDLEDMVSSSSMGVTLLPSLEPDLEDSFLVKLCGSPGKKTGAAIRWAVVIGDDDSLVVTLQGNSPFFKITPSVFIPLSLPVGAPTEAASYAAPPPTPPLLLKFGLWVNINNHQVRGRPHSPLVRQGERSSPLGREGGGVFFHKGA